MSFPIRKYAVVYGYIHHLFAMSNNVWVIITLFVIHSKKTSEALKSCSNTVTSYSSRRLEPSCAGLLKST